MTTPHRATLTGTDPSNLFSFDGWLRGRNLTRTTGYRYRKQGLLHTVNLYGRLYITREEIEKFEARVIRGEFQKEVKPPRRSPKTTVVDSHAVHPGKAGVAAAVNAVSRNAQEENPQLN